MHFQSQYLSQSISEESTSYDLEINRQKIHKKMKRTLKKWSQEPALQEDHKIQALIDALLHTIES